MFLALRQLARRSCNALSRACNSSVETHVHEASGNPRNRDASAAKRGDSSVTKQCSNSDESTLDAARNKPADASLRATSSAHRSAESITRTFGPAIAWIGIFNIG